MPRAHVLYAHPVPESLGAAAHAAALDGLRAGGWEVDDLDLYADGFDPVLSAEERRGYHDTAANTAPVQSYVDRLRAADALVLCFPVWNFGYPAILKGWFDRVMLPGVAFHLKDGRLSPGLDFQAVAAVCTYGATRRMAWLAGDPPRKLIHRIVGGPPWSKRTTYLAQYDMNNATPDDHAAFLARVRATMERFG